MLCPPQTATAVSTNRKQVRFESPLISSYRMITFSSPPPTPLLSPPRSPQIAPSIPPPPIPHPRPLRNQHNRLRLSRSLPNSPQHTIGNKLQSPKAKSSQKSSSSSFVHRLLQTLMFRPSRSSDSLLLSISSTNKSNDISRERNFRNASTSPAKSTSKMSSMPSPQSNMSISTSLTLISSPTPALCQLWKEERRRREALAKFQLAAQIQEHLYGMDYERQFQQKQKRQKLNNGGEAVGERKWLELGGANSNIPPHQFRRRWPFPSHVLSSSRPSAAFDLLLPAGGGVNGFGLTAGTSILEEGKNREARAELENEEEAEYRPQRQALGQPPPTCCCCCQPSHHSSSCRHHCSTIWRTEKEGPFLTSTFWQCPQRLGIPQSHSFPPAAKMATSSSSSTAPSSAQHHHRPNAVQQQHSYNELEDFDDDFVPKHSQTARQNRLNSMDSHGRASCGSGAERVQIRRMSLKEFSGLDLLEEHNQQKAAMAAAASNIQSPPHLHPWKMGGGGQLPALGSLIDKFSTRRRSSSSGGCLLKISPAIENAPHQQSATEDSPYNSFDRAIEGISQAIRESTGGGDYQKELEEQRKEARNRRRGSAQLERQHSGTGSGRATFGQTLQRLNNIRNHLNSTLQSVPNVSPRKVNAFDKEKLLLLNECRVLVAECKEMIRMANPSFTGGGGQHDGGQSTPPDCLSLVQTSVDSAERMVESVEVLIRKSNSIFQAQQLTSNADQLLKTLADTVKEVEKCQKCPAAQSHPQKSGGTAVNNHEQARALIRCSTTMAANLISFTELIRAIG